MRRHGAPKLPSRKFACSDRSEAAIAANAIGRAEDTCLVQPAEEALAMNVDRRLFSEPEQLQGGAGVAAYRFTPLEGGRFAASATTVRIGDVGLQLGHATPVPGLRRAPDRRHQPPFRER